jgi:uncharacterized membrane protein YedE/YeeE
MRILAGLCSGLLFGAGLALSGMINPAKVLNFLDLAGRWDPSLAFVMAGAVAVASVGFRLVLGRGRPLFDTAFHLPTKADIDGPLLLGAAVFGIGWGLIGLCPGPAVASLLLGSSGVLVFVPAMLVGLMAARMLARSTRVVAD